MNPVCPKCKADMIPVSYNGYYESMDYWKCECPDLSDQKGHKKEYDQWERPDFTGDNCECGGKLHKTPYQAYGSRIICETCDKVISEIYDERAIRRAENARITEELHKNGVL